MSGCDNDNLEENGDASPRTLADIEDDYETLFSLAFMDYGDEQEPGRVSASFFRFPAMAKLDERTNIKQLEKVIEEVGEAHDALEAMYNQFRWAFTTQDEAELKRVDRARYAYGMELMDVIHAAETALRMEFEPREVEELRDRVEAKNRERGYYDER